MKNMKNKLFVTLGILGMSLLSYAGTKHSLETSYPSYKGLIMAGYQGWFRGPQDGTGQGYGHYGTGSAIATVIFVLSAAVSIFSLKLMNQKESIEY